MPGHRRQCPLLAQHGRALAEAAAWTGDTQVRNRGTTCGSMAHADVAADQPAGSLALGTTMVAASQSSGTQGDRRGRILHRHADFCSQGRRNSGGDAGPESRQRRRFRIRQTRDVAEAIPTTQWPVRPRGCKREQRHRYADARSCAHRVLAPRPTLAAGAMDAVIGSDGSRDAVAATAAMAVGRGNGAGGSLRLGGVQSSPGNGVRKESADRGAGPRRPRSRSGSASASEPKSWHLGASGLPDGSGNVTASLRAGSSPYSLGRLSQM